MNNMQTEVPGQDGKPTVRAQRTTASAALELRPAKLTDVGQVRPHNEDYVDFMIPSDPRQLAVKGSIFLVADGMGGHQAGEVASRGAVEAVMAHYQADTTHDVPNSLVRAFRAANQQIHTQAESDPAKGGMGTTLVAAVVLGRKVYIANVGDSRAYIINTGGITQITADHSWVEEQVRAGLLSEEQARRHPQRNLVTRALGSKSAVEVDLFEGEISAGDTLLLCTDGLTGRVADHEIAAIVREYTPQEATRKLVALANERGGNDNITVLVINADEAPPTVQAPLPAAAAVPPPRQRAVAPLLAAAAGVFLVLAVAVALLAWTGVLPLFGHPTETPTTMVALTTETATQAARPTLEPSATASPVLGPTSTLVPTSGTPAASSTPTVTAALTPTPTASATPSVVPATPTATVEPELFVLIEPADGATVENGQTFTWQYIPGELEPGLAFEIWVWSGEEDSTETPRKTLSTRRTTFRPNLNLLLRDPGLHTWRVVIVRTSDREPTGQRSASRTFTY